MTGCYVSKEHRNWDNRKEKNYSDNYFYNALKDTCSQANVRLKLNLPYICIRSDGYFHAYSFDKNKNVYSNGWVNERPEFENIIANQYPVGYYKICGDTLTIEEIGSWTLFNRPWKYIHRKKLGLIINDTLKISQEPIDIKHKDKISTPPVGAKMTG